MKNILIAGLLISMSIALTGCTSLWSLQCSKDEILRNRILASGDQDAIHALRSGAREDVAIRAVRLSEGVGVGVDVSNLDALTEHPWRQLGAAILDAGMTAGAVVGGKALVDSINSSDESNNTAGRDIVTVTINSKNNDVDVGDRIITTTEITANE
jgi:hypothetical protein